MPMRVCQLNVGIYCLYYIFGTVIKKMSLTKGVSSMLSNMFRKNEELTNYLQKFDQRENELLFIERTGASEVAELPLHHLTIVPPQSPLLIV